jgi:hypothetical protein
MPLYRTDDGMRWGAGIGRDLVASEIDQNFWELRTAINDLVDSPGSPVEIASITATGNKLYFNMDDASIIGPIYLPVLQLKWRDRWEPGVAYAVLDVFRVVGVGLYSVLQDHISEPNFDPALKVDGEPAYYEMFAFAPAANTIYDVGFYYPGRLSDLTSDIVYIYQEPLVRKILLPIVPTLGGSHQVYMQTPPSTSAQHFNIFQDDTFIGTVNVPIGANVGTVIINANTTFNVGSRLAIGKPTTTDATAAGISVVFAAQQVVE